MPPPCRSNGCGSWPPCRGPHALPSGSISTPRWPSWKQLMPAGSRSKARIHRRTRRRLIRTARIRKPALHGFRAVRLRGAPWETRRPPPASPPTRRNASATCRFRCAPSARPRRAGGGLTGLPPVEAGRRTDARSLRPAPPQATLEAVDPAPVLAGITLVARCLRRSGVDAVPSARRGRGVDSPRLRQDDRKGVAGVPPPATLPRRPANVRAGGPWPPVLRRLRRGGVHREDPVGPRLSRLTDPRLSDPPSGRGGHAGRRGRHPDHDSPPRRAGSGRRSSSCWDSAGTRADQTPLPSRDAEMAGFAVYTNGRI